MTCAHCAAAATRFDRRTADRDRTRYTRRGPDPTTRLLLEELKRRPLAGRTLLDVGGGIGVIGLELLAAGVQRVTLVEASPAYLAMAQELFTARGWEGRFAARRGDFAKLSLPEGADLVTLDRVVCCYPDARRLLSQGAACARDALSLSYPRYRWDLRLVFAIHNVLRRFAGTAFRTYVHPPAEMEAALSGAGFRRVSSRGTFVWRVELWVRGEEGGPGEAWSGRDSNP